MAVSFRAAGTRATGTTSVTVSQPAGVQAGDLLLAFIADRATSGTTTAPTGWTRQAGAAGSGGRFQVYSAIVSQGGLTGTSWAWLSLTTRAEGVIVAYSGVDPTTPLDSVTPTARVNASGTTGTTAVTTVAANRAIVAAFASLANNATWSSEACASGPTLTEVTDSANSTYLSIAVAWGTQSNVGSTGASSSTMSTAAANAGILLALKPGPTLLYAPAPGSPAGVFSKVQSAVGGSSTPAAFPITLASNPAQDDLVVVMLASLYGSTQTVGMSVSDSNGNAYTASPSTPAFASSHGGAYLFYLKAPSNASKTINVSWTSTAAGSIYGAAAEFAASNGSFLFDTDQGATGQAASATISSPTITPSIDGELLVALAAVGNSISAPASGATLGAWTGAGLTANGAAMEYLLSSSGSQAVQFTDAITNDYYSVIIGAFKSDVTPTPSIAVTAHAPTLTSGGVSVTCPTPSGLSLAGKVCALALAVSAVVPAGLHLTAKTPALGSKLAGPIPSVLHLSALAPSKVMATRLNAPAPAALVLSPKVPALSGRYSAPASTALHITGNAPGKVMASRVSCPAPSSLSLSAYAPSDAFHAFRLCLTPAALHTAVYAPALAARFSAASPATLHVTGLVAAKFTSTRLACPAPAAMALSPRAPKLHASVAAPTPAALHLTGLVPSVGGHFSVSCPAPSTLHVAGKIPSTHATTVCPSAHAALNGLVPRLGASVRAGTSSGLALQAFAPARQAAIAAPAAVSLNLLGTAPHLRAGGLVTDPRYVVELPERGWSETLDIIPALVLPARSFAGMFKVKVCSFELPVRTYEVSA